MFLKSVTASSRNARKRTVPMPSGGPKAQLVTVSAALEHICVTQTFCQSLDMDVLCISVKVPTCPGEHSWAQCSLGKGIKVRCKTLAWLGVTVQGLKHA